MTRLLGKLPFQPDRRDLKLALYLDKAALIDRGQAPRLADWAAMPLPSMARPRADTDPLFNDQAGCCVYSAAGHLVKLQAQHTSRPELIVTPGMVRDAYSAGTGYDPTTGANDNGAYIREMLKGWKADGMWGTRPVAYALVNKADPEEVALASWLGGGLIGGYQLPAASQGQTDEHGRPQWTVPAGGFPAGQGPGTWGGHAIYTHGERAGNTWGESLVFDQPWADACCDELWFCLVDCWQTAGRAPNGFDWQQLVTDAEARSAA